MCRTGLAMQRFLPLLLVLGFGPIAAAEVHLPAIFSDHMVLQQGRTAPVWGWADPGERVTVAIGDQRQSTETNGEGRWQVDLEPLKAGETFTLKIEGENRILIEDVLAGEVWLCVGQSNMQFRLSGAHNASEARANAETPEIRMFTVPTHAAATPDDGRSMRGEWVVCSPETVIRFSAVAYFFGRDLHDRLDTPIGLINASWGGTLIEAWTSREGLETLASYEAIPQAPPADAAAEWDEDAAMARYQERLAAWEQAAQEAETAGEPAPRRPRRPINPRLDKNIPANLYNGMIHPIIPYAIRGAIWYQGESNALRSHANLYRAQLETLIRDWRQRWGHDFPVAWVQLPEFGLEGKRSHNWSVVREQMLEALAIPNTGMAITLGLGDPDDVHPRNKEGVGERLAAWALSAVYEQTEVVPSGPIMESYEIRDNEVVIAFRHTHGGLEAKDGKWEGIVIAGEDQTWHEASARIEQDKLIVWSPEVTEPVAVRYAWGANPRWSLVNGAGLPASPFRTDRWAFVSSAPSSPAEDVPAVSLASVDKAELVLDGRLDDAVWQSLSEHRLRELGSGDAPAQATTFRVFWHDGALYFGIRCAEDEMDQLKIATQVDDDGSIWNGDNIELMLRTPTHTYYQLAISPAGALVDLDREGGNITLLWSSGAEVATYRGDDYWSIELRLPVGEADGSLNGIADGKPTADAPWYFNVCRQRHAGDDKTYTALAAEGVDSFHNVASFAELK